MPYNINNVMTYIIMDNYGRMDWTLLGNISVFQVLNSVTGITNHFYKQVSAVKRWKFD